MRFPAALAGIGLMLLATADLRADLPPPYEPYGIGVRLKDAEPYPTVSSVVKGSAAEKSGVVNGDAVIAIDGTYAQGVVPFYYFAGKLSGRKGSEVELVVLHEGREVRVVKVKRLQRN